MQRGKNKFSPPAKLVARRGTPINPGLLAVPQSAGRGKKTQGAVPSERRRARIFDCSLGLKQTYNCPEAIGDKWYKKPTSFSSLKEGQKQVSPPAKLAGIWGNILLSRNIKKITWGKVLNAAAAVKTWNLLKEG